MVPLPHSRKRSTRYSDRLQDFFDIMPRSYKELSAYEMLPFDL